MKRLFVVLSIVLTACSSPVEPNEPKVEPRSVYAECWRIALLGTTGVNPKFRDTSVRLVEHNVQNNTMIVEFTRNSELVSRILFELVPQQNPDFKHTSPWVCKTTEI